MARTKRRGAQVKAKGKRPAKHSKKKAQTAPVDGRRKPPSTPNPETRKPPGDKKKKPAGQVKQECTQRVVNEMEEIIGALIKKAKDGSSQHAKFLFDFAGVEEGGGEEESSPGREAESLAELLLRRLDAAAAGAQPLNSDRTENPGGAFAPREAKPAPDSTPATAKAACGGDPPAAEPGEIRPEQNGERAGLG